MINLVIKDLKSIYYMARVSDRLSAKIEQDLIGS